MEAKQVNFKFQKEIVEMLEELIDYYSAGDYKKYSKVAIMQSLIYNDYQDKIGNRPSKKTEKIYH